MLHLPPLGTILRQVPGEPPVHPTGPDAANLPVQRRLGPDELTELVTAYRQGVPVKELAARFGINRSTVLGHARRHGIPKRDRHALGPDGVEKAIQLYATGRSAESIAEELQVGATTVRCALKDAGVALRPGGRRRSV